MKGIQGPTSNNQNHKMIIVPVSSTPWIHNPRKEDWIIATQVEYICCCLWQKTMDNYEKVLNHGNSWRWIKKFWKEGCKSTTMYIGKQSEAKKVWKIYVENNIFFNQKGRVVRPLPPTLEYTAAKNKVCLNKMVELYCHYYHINYIMIFCLEIINPKDNFYKGYFLLFHNKNKC